jgi:hypothetical protein
MDRNASNPLSVELEHPSALEEQPVSDNTIDDTEDLTLEDLTLRDEDEETDDDRE